VDIFAFILKLLFTFDIQLYESDFEHLSSKKENFNSVQSVNNLKKIVA
jgi:hypothetical protein